MLQGVLEMHHKKAGLVGSPPPAGICEVGPNGAAALGSVGGIPWKVPPLLNCEHPLRERHDSRAAVQSYPPQIPWACKSTCKFRCSGTQCQALAMLLLPRPDTPLHPLQAQDIAHGLVEAKMVPHATSPQAVCWHHHLSQSLQF